MEFLALKPLFGYLAIGLTFVAFFPYVRTILRGATRPHVFSWVIWSVTTFIVFLAQLADSGGIGAWPTGVSGVITFYVAYLAYRKKADIHITRSDWIFFLFAVSSIPLWYVTENPLYAVVILTFIDVLGFLPTYRKAYHYPEEENLFLYAAHALKSALSIVALEHYSVTTVLFPATIACLSAIFVVMVRWRKKVLAELN